VVGGVYDRLLKLEDVAFLPKNEWGERLAIHKTRFGDKLELPVS